MNENIDAPLESMKEPGQIWINAKSKQLRYSVDKTEQSKWITPLSEYQVGNQTKDNKTPFVKRGQPVSIGFIDELDAPLKTSGDSCVVPTDSRVHQWCIGIALEPGSSVKTETYLDHIHILSHGQIEYNLDDLNDPYKEDKIYLPPHDTVNGKEVFDWDYNDIGKPVMVSNHPDDKGGLTIDITHAYFNGANIVTVGHIADAPIPDGNDVQKIVIEIQLAGDTRGMVDSTQFDVKLSSIVPKDANDNDVMYTQSTDRLIFVKMTDDPDTEQALGLIITNDDDLLNINPQNAPIGCFLAKSKNNQIKLSDYAGETVLIHRLGIVESNFGFSQGDIGKELFLSNGAVTTTGAALGYEYKVGVVLEEKRVLVDCRYPREFGQFEMIGKIKPAYTDIETGNLITDPGYAIIDKNVVHKVSGIWAGDTQYPTVDFSELLKIAMYQGIILYSANSNGPFEEINGNLNFNNISNGYFKFKDMLYSLDGKVAAQIKISNEGAPDNIQYLWPMRTYQVVITPNPPGGPVWNIDNSPIKLDISSLTEIGVYIDGAGENIESYEITCRLPFGDGGRYLSPGFHSLSIEENEETKTKWFGFEWALVFDRSLQTWFITMVTDPSGYDILDSVSSEDVLGFCYPPGQQPAHAIELLVTIRRRPVQYHGLLLNQVMLQNPWAPKTLGDDLVTKNTLYFGDMYSGPGSDGTWSLNMKGANSVFFNNYAKDKDPTGTKDLYIKLLKYTIGPYFENVLSEPKLPNKLEIHYQPVSFENTLISGHLIKWIYDFDNNIVGLGAEFGPKLVSYPTTKDISGVDDKPIQQVIFHEDYIAGATNKNVSGYYFAQRSALKTLHEVPVQFFNYFDDLDTTHKRIHTIQEAWNTSGYISGEDTLIYSIQKYMPSGYLREIFPPVKGSYHDGTTYAYKSNNKKVPKDSEEWEHIVEEINYMFNSIQRDSSNNIIVGGDTTYIHTNLGLLNQASKETQDRLLRLERSLFGANWETLPNGIILSDYKYHKLKQIPDTLHNAGIARELQFLYDIGLILPENDTEEDPEYINKVISGFYSDYKTLLWEFYGDYLDEDSYTSGYYPNTEYEPKPDSKNRFHELYIWWLRFADDRGLQYDTKEYSVFDGGVLKLGKNRALINAKNVFFEKYYSGYYSENLSEDSIDPPLYKYPFAWPMPGINNSGFLSLESNFFNESVFGLSDRKVITINGTEYKGHNIDAQSLEGIIYDIIAKLSLVRNTFDEETHQYSHKYANIFPHTDYIIEEGSIYPAKNFRCPESSLDYSKSSNYPVDIKNFSGYYSAFTSISGKFHNMYGLSLEINSEPDLPINLDYKIKNSPNIYLTTKPKYNFENYNYSTYNDCFTTLANRDSFKNRIQTCDGETGVWVRDLDSYEQYFFSLIKNEETDSYSWKALRKVIDNKIVEYNLPLREGFYETRVPVIVDINTDPQGQSKNSLFYTFKITYNSLNPLLTKFLPVKLGPHPLDSDTRVQDIYYHIPRNSFHKWNSNFSTINVQVDPFNPDAWLNWSGVSQTTLGEFVMPDNNYGKNKFYHQESGYYFISGKAITTFSGNVSLNNQNISFNGISGYGFNGVSGHRFRISGYNNYIDEKTGEYIFYISGKSNNTQVHPSSLFVTGEQKEFISGTKCIINYYKNSEGFNILKTCNAIRNPYIKYSFSGVRGFRRKLYSTGIFGPSIEVVEDVTITGANLYNSNLTFDGNEYFVNTNDSLEEIDSINIINENYTELISLDCIDEDNGWNIFDKVNEYEYEQRIIISGRISNRTNNYDSNIDGIDSDDIPEFMWRGTEKVDYSSYKDVCFEIPQEVKKDTIHYLDTSNHEHLDYISGLYTESTGERAYSGLLNTDVIYDYNELSGALGLRDLSGITPSANLPLMSGYLSIPTVSGIVSFQNAKINNNLGGILNLNETNISLELIDPNIGTGITLTGISGEVPITINNISLNNLKFNLKYNSDPNSTTLPITIPRNQSLTLSPDSNISVQSNITEIINIEHDMNYNISGTTFVDTLITDLKELFNTFSGIVGLISGRLLSRESSISADLNSQIVSTRLYFDPIEDVLSSLGPYDSAFWVPNNLVLQDLGSKKEFQVTIPEYYFIGVSSHNPDPNVDYISGLFTSFGLDSIYKTDISSTLDTTLPISMSDRVILAKPKNVSLSDLQNAIKIAFSNNTIPRNPGETDEQYLERKRAYEEYYLNAIEYNKYSMGLDEKAKFVIISHLLEERPGYPNPVVTKPIVEGTSAGVRGDVLIGTTSGYYITNYDEMNRPYQTYIDNSEDMLNNKGDINGLLNFVVSGIIYGRHLTDDAEISVRIKKREHLLDSFHLVVMNGNSPQDVFVSKEDIDLLKNNISYKIYDYDDSLKIAVISIGEIGNLKDSSFSIFSTLNLAGKIDFEGTLFELPVKAILDTNKFLIEIAYDSIDPSKTPPFYIYIVPGIVDRIIYDNRYLEGVPSEYTGDFNLLGELPYIKVEPTGSLSNGDFKSTYPDAKFNAIQIGNF